MTRILEGTATLPHMSTSSNQLENFIKFHLFKWPALLLAVGVLGLFGSQVLLMQNKETAALLVIRQKIDFNQLQTFGHLLLTNKTPDDVVKQQKLDITFINKDPYQITCDLDNALKLENLGLIYREVSIKGDKVKATLAPYPPQLK